MAWVSAGHTGPDRAMRWNLAFIWMFNMVWALGNPMVNSATMVASFFDKLGCKPVVIGMLQLCASLPVLIQFLPRLIHWKAHRLKWQMIGAYALAGVGYIAYGVAALLSWQNPGVFVPVMLALYFMVFCMYQLAYILYLDYIMRLFPVRLIGRFYGVNGLFMSIGAIAGGAITGVVHKSLAFPANYGWLFMLAGVVFIISTVLCTFTVMVCEPVVENARSGFRAYLVRSAVILRQRGTRLFMLLVLLLYVNQASYGYALLFFNREMGMGVDPAIATVIAYVSQSVLLLAVGYGLDKLGGMKTVMGYITLALLANVAILLPHRFSYAVVFAIYGMYVLFASMIKVWLANAVASPEDRLDTVILANVAGVLAGSLLSLAYGLLAEKLGSYRFMFVVSAASAVPLYAVAVRLGSVVGIGNGTGGRRLGAAADRRQ